MKKTPIACAALSLVSASTLAQNNVSIYGVADVAIAHLDGSNVGSRVGLFSGVKNGSRIGFRGTEELRPGLNANFVLENGFNIDDGTLGQGGRLFGRRATVGVSGDLGRVDLGRRNTPFFNAIDNFEPMETGYAGAANNLIFTYGTRMENSIFYTSPSFGGLVADVAYGFGEQAESFARERHIGGSLTYTNGPVGIALAHHNANDQRANERKSTGLIGKYDFKVAAAHLGYVRASGNARGAVSGGAYTLGTVVDSNDVIAGVTVPFGASSVRLSYIRKDDKSALNRDANQAAVAYTYSLSKRTSLYTSYARINNKNGANFITEAGVEGAEREFNLGIQHRF